MVLMDEYYIHIFIGTLLRKISLNKIIPIKLTSYNMNLKYKLVVNNLIGRYEYLIYLYLMKTTI